MTDASRLSSPPERAGRATRSKLRASRSNQPDAVAREAAEKGAADQRSRRDRAGGLSRRCSSRMRSPTSSVFSRTIIRSARTARRADATHRPARRSLRREDLDRRRRARSTWAAEAFDFEGTPKQRVQLVENGVVRGRMESHHSRGRRSTAPQSTAMHLRQSYAIGTAAVALSVTRATPSRSTSSPRSSATVSTSRVCILGVVHPRKGVITG